MNTHEFNSILNTFVLSRYKNIEELKKSLSKVFPYSIIEIENKEELPEDDFSLIEDYCFIGTITDDKNYFDFDIWYLKDRQDNIVVTETAGEEQ